MGSAQNKANGPKKEQEGSFLMKAGRCKVQVSRRKSQTLGPCVHWSDSKPAGDTWPPVEANAANLRSTAFVPRRWGHLTGPGPAGGLPLPPMLSTQTGARQGKAADAEGGRR